MKIIRYGITLKRIREEDIELVRHWRNSPSVRNRMEYREYITKEMQKEWFRKIDNTDNFFYIIEYKGEKAGLISEKKIAQEDMPITESGLFLSEPRFYNSYLPVLVSLTLIEASFFFHKGRESYIHVLKDNTQAINYNKSLGYELCEGQDNITNQKYVLTRESFQKKANKLRKAALALSGNDNKMYLHLDRQDYESGLGEHYNKLIKQSGLPVKIQDGPPEGETVYYLDFNEIEG